MKNEEKQDLTFEEAVSRAEELAAQMENGSLSLEESLRCYEEGTRLLNLCEEKLQAARLKIEQVSQGGADEND